MTLSNSMKIWIFHNIRSFLKKDLYFKYLDTDILCQQLKYALKISNFLSDLKENLPRDYHQSFKFYRKQDKFFIYPSLFTQIESLIMCWDEILAIKSTLNTGLVIEDIEENDNADEEDSEDFIQDTVPYKFRKCFGQAANTFSHYNLKRNDTVKVQILSRISSIKKDYTKEYSNFKKKLVLTCNDICTKGKAATVLQTDIKSFYHSIDTIDLVNVLNKTFPEKCNKIIHFLKRLRKETKSKELPIGWILSGPLSDIMLNLIHTEIPGSGECHYINYVDDFIIIKEKDPSSPREPQKKEIDFCFKELETAFSKVFKKSKIKFHKEGEKIRKWHLDNHSLGAIDMAWFDFNDSSLEQDGEFKWNGVNEFLLPADNDLNLNEKVQFLANLKNIKDKVLNDEIREWEQFNDYFKKILFKIANTGVKYIPVIVDTLMTFSRSNFLSDTNSIIKLNAIADSIKSNDAGPNLWLALFKSLYNYTDNKEVIDWIDLKAVEAINYYISKKLNTDALLLKSWLILFRQKNQIQINEHNLVKDEDPDYFFFNEVLKFNNFSSKISHQTFLNDSEFNEFIGINVIRYRESETILDQLKNILMLSSNKVFSAIILEGLYLFSRKISFDDILELQAMTSNYSAQKLLANLLESADYAKRYIYEHYPYQKIEEYNKFIKLTKKGNKSRKAAFIEEIANDSIYIAKKEMVSILLHLSSDIDHWKKIYLLRDTTFDFANYISPKYSPDVYPELGIYFFTAIKGILSTKVGNILSSRCKKESKDRIEKIATLKQAPEKGNSILGLNIDVIHRLAYKKEVKVKENFLITVAPLSFDIDKDYTPENNYGHSKNTTSELRKKIHQCLQHAIHTKSDFLIFPELCLPRKELKHVLETAGKSNIIVIAGLEGTADSMKCYRNTTVISFPINKKKSPISKPFLAFYQDKNFPAAVEEHALITKGYTYIHGKSIFCFKSTIYGNFSILTCSDFISTKLKAGLKSHIQMLFVPAVNHDNSTYNVISESCIRELFCYCIICNNSKKGTTSVLAPFNLAHKRLVYSSHGQAIPSYATVSINTSRILQIQNLTPYEIEVARKNKEHSLHEIAIQYKQLPPDWTSFKKKTP